VPARKWSARWPTLRNFGEVSYEVCNDSGIVGLRDWGIEGFKESEIQKME
jgi:hypothetical protein